MDGNETTGKWSAAVLAILLAFLPACNQWAFPRIDPTGQRLFVPGATTTITPPRANCLSKLCNRTPPANAFDPMAAPAINPQPVSAVPVTVPVAPMVALPQAVQPVINSPAVPTNAKAPPCEYQGAIGSCLELHRKAKELGVPAKNPNRLLHRGKRGELNLTPARIVAPVGSEVVVMGGICGKDGYFVPHQPIEFNLSQDSVGQISDASSRHTNPVTNWLKASTRKDSIDFVNMMTSLKSEVIDRGTPTPVDDIKVEKGQAWISVSSASPGTSYITALAPEAEAWDKRIKTTEIHWVDALWNIPTPVTATAGAKYPLTTLIRKADDGLGVDNWKVRYEIAGGAPAEFLPSHAQTAEIVTGPDGKATAEIQQPEGQFGPGTTFIRVDIIRPANNSSGYEVIESAVTQIRWVAAALTIRAIGPKTVAIKNPFTYRLEVTNPGDQIARDATVSLQGLPEGITFVGANPKPTAYGDQLQWNIGDVPPSTTPNIIDLQFQSQTAAGLVQLCFDVESTVDQLKTRACAETQIVAPCLGVSINGPKEARVGEQAPFELTFVNQCQQDLTNVVVDVRFGSGIEAVGKTGSIHYTMSEPLRYNESKTLPLTLLVREEGNHCFQVEMQADGGHTASIRRCIVAKNVNEPSVKLEVSSQIQTQVNQTQQVQAMVTNTGNVPLTNVKVFNSVSNSLQPTLALPQASQEGEYTVIELGTIAPGGRQPITIEYNTIAIDGNAYSRFEVRCDQQVQDIQETPLRIVGLNGTLNQPSTNNQGPVQIPGNNANAQQPAGQLAVSLTPSTMNVRREQVFTMDITITNQRSTSDRNVRIALNTPPGVIFEGPVNPNISVRSSGDGLQHEFAGLQELRAGGQETLSVRLRATAAGTVQVTAISVSDSATIPVESTASVNVSL